jgi:chromosome segregation ATPase
MRQRGSDHQAELQRHKQQEMGLEQELQEAGYVRERLAQDLEQLGTKCENLKTVRGQCYTTISQLQNQLDGKNQEIDQIEADYLKLERKYQQACERKLEY